VAGNKLVIIGMNNPQSDLPEHAFWPAPEGCAGHRLWLMATARTGISQDDWLAMTDRRNLLVGPWSKQEAVAAATALRPSLEGRTVLALGREVAWCLGMDCEFGDYQWDWRDWRSIPHPSGLNRWYNCDAQRIAVEIMLADYIRGYEESSL
jgi:hypothetical protein